MHLRCRADGHLELRLDRGPIQRNRAAPRTLRIYFSWQKMPELKVLPGPERRIAWRACYRRTMRHWQAWAALVISALIAIGCGALFLWLVFRIGFGAFHIRTRTGLIVMYGLGGFGGGVVIGAVFEFLRWRIVAEQIVAYLHEYLQQRNSRQRPPDAVSERRQ